jgi:small-conductance mechanosensitive channel
MLFTPFNNKKIHLLAAVVAVMLLTFQPVLSQPFRLPKADSAKTMVSDSLLPGLMMKVAYYTATIDHTDFLIRRKFNITPISFDLPDIERRVKGFKSRLEKKGNEMNLRSLNSGIIMLHEISGKLDSYHRVLTNFSKELTRSNTEVKKILRDPVLNFHVSDSVLLQQLQDIRVEGHELDSMQQKTLAKVNLLRNKVSVNLLQATDIISDMRYLAISFKMAMWDPEESPLFRAMEKEYKNELVEITSLGLQRSWLIILIYLKGKWNVITLGLMLFIFTFSWTLLNMRRIRKQQNVAAVLAPMHFLCRSISIGCLMGFFTYVPFFFSNPPMSFLHACEVLRLVTLTFLILPYLSKQSKIIWALLSLLWVYYALDNILLESAFGERWGLFFAGILLAAICVKIVINKKPAFIKLAESPAIRALAIFSLTQVVLSIIFNLTGRVSLAKIFGVSAIQCLILGVSLKVFCTMVLEAIYVHSEAYQDSRFAKFINYKILEHQFLRILWVLSITAWTVSLTRNFTLYDAMIEVLGSFFTETRTIGSMVFSFKSVAIFICIIWLSSMISGAINFFFGNQKIKNSNRRSRLGSMMLLIRLTIWTLGFCIAVAAAGIPLDKLSLMIGALGVGIGFGLQNIVNNLVSGVILAFERPIQVGDLIEVGGKTGVVKEIGVRSSKINNNEGADIIVPNGDLLSQHLINWTMQDRNKQIEFLIDVPYDSDIKKVSLLIQETLANNDKILKSQPPAVVLHQFGDLAIKLKVLFWVQDLTEAGAIRSNAMIEIYGLLAASGIQFPAYKGPIGEPLIPKSITPWKMAETKSELS